MVKAKKVKPKTVSLHDFLGGTNGGGPDTTTVVVPMSSWASEMEEDDRLSSRGKSEALVLPTAPRAARSSNMDDARVPKDPPYTAYIANLSYDVSTEVIMKFFSKLKIKTVRLPRDGDAETGRLKGFGYAEFEDRQSLVEALGMSDHLLQNRKIRIDLSTYAGKGTTDRPSFSERGSGGRYGNRDEDDRTAGDWRSGPPPPPRDNGRGWERSDSDKRGNDRDGGRGFNRYDGSRDGGGFDRNENRSYGFGRDDRGFGGDRFGRNDGTRDDRAFDRNRRSPDVPIQRPRLNLKKRSEQAESRELPEGTNHSTIFGGARPVDTAKKEAEIEQKLEGRQTRVRFMEMDSNQTDENKGKSSEKEKENGTNIQIENELNRSKPERASIFGSAKPVDTSAKEREIEEKIKKQTLSKPSVAINGDRNDMHNPTDGSSRRNNSMKLERNGSNSREEGENRQNNKVEVKKPTSKDIFGAAKPVDTQTREREIEEKMKQIQIVSSKNNKDRKDVDRKSITPRDSQKDEKRLDNEANNRKDRKIPIMKKADETKIPNFAGSNKFSFLQGDDELVDGNGSDSQ